MAYQSASAGRTPPTNGGSTNPQRYSWRNRRLRGSNIARSVRLGSARNQTRAAGTARHSVMSVSHSRPCGAFATGAGRSDATHSVARRPPACIATSCGRADVASPFMASNARNTGAPCAAYVRDAGSAMNSDAAAIAAAPIGSHAALRTSSATPVRYAIAGISGSAYRTVSVSWKSRWNAAYGPNATMRSAAARGDLHASRTNPHDARVETTSPSTQPHGHTKELRTACAATRADRRVQSISTPEKSSAPWLRSACR